MIIRAAFPKRVAQLSAEALGGLVVTRVRLRLPAALVALITAVKRVRRYPSQFVLRVSRINSKIISTRSQESPTALSQHEPMLTIKGRADNPAACLAPFAKTPGSPQLIVTLVRQCI